MEVLYRLYRLFGKRTLDRLALIPCACAWAFHPAVRRRAGSFRKLRNFVQALVDKLVVLSDGPEQPVLVPDDHPDTRDFFADLEARKGVFMLTSHLGNAEALPALGKPGVVFHAFLHREQTALFNAFCARHAKRTDIRIHPVSGFDVGTVFEAGAWLDDGDCLVMAGDRGFGRTRPHAFRNETRDFPVGVFRLAKTLGHPVYFAACIQDAPNHYRVLFRHLPCDDSLFEAFLAVLAPLVDRYPDQWYHWDFTSQASPPTPKP
jgi:predicted LPLAT superfamily acyltransferase